MTTPKLLTNEETQALFNFPDHIKFKFDWDGPGFDLIQLEENLFVSFTKLRYDRAKFLFTARIRQNHNPYGPYVVWIDGSTFYRINGVLHRLGGPANHILRPNGEWEDLYFINGIEYSALEYWIEVEKYKQEHGI